MVYPFHKIPLGKNGLFFQANKPLPGGAKQTFRERKKMTEKMFFDVATNCELLLVVGMTLVVGVAMLGFMHALVWVGCKILEILDNKFSPHA